MHMCCKAGQVHLLRIINGRPIGCLVGLKFKFCAAAEQGIISYMQLPAADASRMKNRLVRRNPYKSSNQNLENLEDPSSVQTSSTCKLLSLCRCSRAIS